MPITLKEADEMSVVQAMTVISEFCDGCLDCLECPFGSWKDANSPHANCVLVDNPPYYWREKYAEIIG